MNNRELGSKGEEIAVNYLKEQGYKILDTNVHFSRFCEIDILAIDRDVLVAVEVKTRSNGVCGSPLEAITRKKLQNITTGLFTYINTNKEYKRFRIDAISIILKPEIKIQHLKSIYL